MTTYHTDGGTTADRRFDDPEFSTVAVSLGVADALDEITDAVKGLHATGTAVGTKVRTTDGMLVAVVQAGSADDTALVNYRIEPASDLATRKGRKIGETLTQFETDAEVAPSQ